MSGSLKRGKEIESYRWVILCVVYLSVLAFALIFQSIPPILPLIISELHITYAQSGLLMGLFALPGLFISLLGGFLSDRYRMRPLGIACFSLKYQCYDCGYSFNYKRLMPKIDSTELPSKEEISKKWKGAPGMNHVRR
jgi:MFS family permease